MFMVRSHLAGRVERVAHGSRCTAIETGGRPLRYSRQMGANVTAVDVRPSRLATARKVADVVFSYTDRKTWATEQWFARIDVTEEFPFLVSLLAQYFER